MPTGYSLTTWLRYIVFANRQLEHCKINIELILCVKSLAAQYIFPSTYLFCESGAGFVVIAAVTHLLLTDISMFFTLC